MNFSITALLSFVLQLMLLTTSAFARSNFQMSCDNIKLVHNYLKPGPMSANCRRYNGEIHYTEMNLNACVVNDRGILSFRPGGSGLQSCESCYFANQSGELVCYCRTGKKFGTSYETMMTRLQLSTFVSNRDGNLVCDG